METCKYNPGCECEVQKCEKCGWNPKVADRRLKRFRAGLGMFQNKYKIPFTGYCEVWAESAREAAQKVGPDTMCHAEYKFDKPVCVTMEDEDELD